MVLYENILRSSLRPTCISTFGANGSLKLASNIRSLIAFSLDGLPPVDLTLYLHHRRAHALFVEMAPPLNPIDAKSTRWEPTPDPNEIVVPGLDTTASVNDQIYQIEHLITIKLQVYRILSREFTS